jgi:hypothetical protein
MRVAGIAAVVCAVVLAVQADICMTLYSDKDCTVGPRGQVPIPSCGIEEGCQPSKEGETGSLAIFCQGDYVEFVTYDQGNCTGGAVSGLYPTDTCVTVQGIGESLPVSFSGCSVTGLSAPQIFGIVIACMVGLLLIIWSVQCCYRSARGYSMYTGMK